MPFDPALPANNSLVSSAELRDQLNGLKELVDACVTQDEFIPFTADTARNLDPSLTRLDMAVSDPPTQAEVQAIADKVDALIDALRRP